MCQHPGRKEFRLKKLCCLSVAFPGADTLLGPEMRSTGEVMSFGASFPEAFAKAQIAAGNPLPAGGSVLASLSDPDKREGMALLAQLYDMGFSICGDKRNSACAAGDGYSQHRSTQSRGRTS